MNWFLCVAFLTIISSRILFIPDEENKEVSPEPNPNYIVDKALELAAANARLQNELDKLKQELTKYKDKEQNNKKEGIAS